MTRFRNDNSSPHRGVYRGEGTNVVKEARSMADDPGSERFGAQSGDMTSNRRNH